MYVDEIKKKIMFSLMECSFWKDDYNIRESDSIFKKIDINTIQLLEYLINVEKSLGFELNYDLLSIEDLDSIDSLTEFIMENVNE